MDLSNTSFRYYFLLFLLFALIATALLSPIAANNIVPDLNDFFNHIISIMQAKLALSQGQFPLRTAPLEHLGWGYPLYQFYASTSYTLAGLMYRWITPSNPFVAYKLTLWCALMVGGLYMYRLAYWFIRSKPAAILASVVYLLSPYNILLINHMAAFNEVIALCILPALIYYMLQRYYHPANMKTLLQVAFVCYLLATTHIITFVYTTLFGGIWLLLITLKSRGHWKNLFAAFFAYAFGCLLALWSLGPIFLLQKYLIVHSALHLISPFNALSPPLSRLFSPVSQLNVSIVTGSDAYTAGAQPTIGWAMIIAVGLCLCGYLYSPLKKYRRANYLLSSLLILYALVFFMIWSPINFWQWLPESFRMVQMSWRLFGQLTWVGSLLFAWAVCWLFQNKLDIRHVALGILLIVVTSSVWFSVTEMGDVKLSDIVKNPVMTFNADAYMIDAIKNPSLVDVMDNMKLNPYKSDKDKKKQDITFKLPFFLPANMVQSGQLNILLQGYILENTQAGNQKVNVFVNGKLVMTQDAKPGAFEWKFPLTALHELLKKQSELVLTFKANRAGSSVFSPIKVTIDNVLLAGFLKPATVLTTRQMQSHCAVQKADTVCELNVPSTVRLLELPSLYYPDLLNVTNNGKPVAYYSVYSEGRLMTGVHPEAGKLNHIVVQFRGFLWANFISATMWWMWIIYVVYLAAVYFRDTVLVKRHSMTWAQNALSRRFGLTLFFACCALLILYPLVVLQQVPDSADYINHLVGIILAKFALMDGQFPLRVSAVQLWQYPYFQFYSSTTYTVAGLMYRWLFTNNPLAVYKSVLFVTAMIGGLYMYRLAYWFTKVRSAAILSAVVYMTSPYYLLVSNRIGGLNEAVAIGVIPVVLFYTMLCFYRADRYLVFLQMSVAWYVLATVHNITFLYTSLFVALLLLIYTIQNRNTIKNLFAVGGVYCFSLMLAAWYLAPIVLYAKFLAITTLFSDAQAINHFRPSISTLLSPFYSMGLLPSQTAVNILDLIHPNIGIFIVIAVAVCFYALVKKRGLKNQMANTWLLPLVIMFCLAFLLIWAPLNIWQWMPSYFHAIQYSWRILSQVMWIGSLLFAWALCWMFHEKLRLRYIMLLLLFIFCVTVLQLPSLKGSINPSDLEKDMSPLTNIKRPWLATGYYIDGRINPAMINIIDNASLFYFMPKWKLNAALVTLNSPRVIPTSLVRSAYAPYLLMDGEFRDTSPGEKQLVASVDGILIGTYDLKPGAVNWKLPLNPHQPIFQQHPRAYLQLSMNVPDAQKNSALKPALSLNKLVLDGLLDPAKVLSLSAVEPVCHPEHDQGVCQVMVPATTQFIELPILYFPNLLTITRNGKPVRYWSVLYRNQLIAGIAAEPGKANTIRYQFTGLLWANFLSQAAWGVFGIIGLFVVLRRMTGNSGEKAVV